MLPQEVEEFAAVEPGDVVVLRVWEIQVNSVELPGGLPQVPVRVTEFGVDTRVVEGAPVHGREHRVDPRQLDERPIQVNVLDAPN